MFRNTKETFSGGEYLCLAKVTCGSMVQVHVNSVSIVVAYISCCVCVCTGRTATRTNTQQLIQGDSRRNLHYFGK